MFLFCRWESFLFDFYFYILLLLSYIKLSDLVDQMFPPFKTKGHPPSGLVASDQFSSFTYWRAPLPDITADDLDDVGDEKNEGTSSKQWLLKVNKCESSFRTRTLTLQHHCVVPKNIHTPHGGQRKFWGEGGHKGGSPPEWKFQRGGGLKRNCPPWGVCMDIFGNYTLTL